MSIYGIMREEDMGRRWMRASKIRLPTVVLVAAALVFTFTNLASYLLFNHIPHVHDEIAYLFQAKIFSLGKLHVPSPCSRGAFDFSHMINNGKWYSQYPPGFPLILLLGLMIGMPWIINPVLAASSVIVMYYLGKEIYGEPEGRLAAILASLSIWFLLMSSTMLSHTGSMFFFSIFLLFLFRSIAVPSLSNGLVAGFGLGIAFLIRPYNIAVISVPLLIFYGLRSVPKLRPRSKNMAGLTTALFLAAIALLIYNQATTGSPFRMGYIEKYGGAHGIGFGRSGYLSVPHSPARGFLLIGENMAAINRYLFGWPFSSLVFFVPFLIPIKDDKKKLGADLLLALSFLSLTFGLFFYWGTLVFVGARMFFDAFPLLVLMSARGISKTPIILSKLKTSWSPRSVRRVVSYALVFFSLFAFVFTFPRWIHPPHTEAYNSVLTKDFAGVTHRINRTIKQLPIGRALVIMKFLFEPQEYFPDGGWGSGFLYDDPKLENMVIYARDQGPANRELLLCHPERRSYLFIGTLDKGMLIPLELKADQLQYGSPVIFRIPDKGSIELVGIPQELFFGYSNDFRLFLDALYARYPFYDIDVSRLVQLSRQAREEGQIERSAFDLEAALQIENDPWVRSQLLSQLAFVYFKTGRPVEAKRILDRLADLNDPRVYDVFPEKGF
jgi:hypothetical protein